MAKLVLSLNGVVLNQFFTEHPELRIGRASDNEIAINDAQLAEHHARIVCIGEDHILEDQGNDAGILVNGRRCFRQILQHRDVIELGSHHLRYLNSKVGSELSLDRTMLIAALPHEGQRNGPIAAPPSARAGRLALPEGHVRVLRGQGEYSDGQLVRLSRVITTFGIPGEQLVVLTSRPQGFFVSHVEGAALPRVNQKSIGHEAAALHEGDVIDAAGYRLEFHAGPPPAKG